MQPHIHTLARVHTSACVIIFRTVEGYRSHKAGFESFAVLRAVGDFVTVLFGSFALGTLLACATAVVSLTIITCCGYVRPVYIPLSDQTLQSGLVFVPHHPLFYSIINLLLLISGYLTPKWLTILCSSQRRCHSLYRLRLATYWPAFI